MGLEKNKGYVIAFQNFGLDRDRVGLNFYRPVGLKQIGPSPIQDGKNRVGGKCVFFSSISQEVTLQLEKF